MKAIAINGSPRPGGNTEILLKKVLEPLEAAGWSTEYLRIGGKPVRGCIACLKCVEKRNRRCNIEDDINDYLEQMYAADAIILGSPTYFGGITPELKALIDRAGFVALANGGAFSGKIGAAVVAADAVEPPTFSTPLITCFSYLLRLSQDPYTGTWAWGAIKGRYLATMRPCGI